MFANWDQVGALYLDRLIFDPLTFVIFHSLTAKSTKKMQKYLVGEYPRWDKLTSSTPANWKKRPWRLKCLRSETKKLKPRWKSQWAKDVRRLRSRSCAFTTKWVKVDVTDICHILYDRVKAVPSPPEPSSPCCNMLGGQWRAPHYWWRRFWFLTKLEGVVGVIILLDISELKNNLRWWLNQTC